MSSFRDMLLDLPALAPPEGVEPNFTNPPSNRPLALGIMIPCAIVTVVMTFMRIYVKTFIIREWNWDDYLLPVAFLFSAAEFAACVHVYTYAPVIHQWDMTIRTVSKFLLDFHIGAIFYFMTIMTLKICILIQFLRIFVPIRERSKTYWATHIMIWVNSIFYVTTTFIEIFACRPMKKQWDPLITTGKCVNSPLSYMVSQSFNLALDLIILIWTQKVIWSLQMPTSRKIKLGVLFLAGFIACIFGALSVWTTVEMMHTQDQAYWAAWNALFTFPETTSGFVVLCLPVVPKFVKHMQSNLFPSTIKSSTLPSRDIETPGRRSPRRSWWHITGGSLGSKISTLMSGKWTGTTATQNGEQENTHPSTLDENKLNSTFLTFGPPELNLRLDCEDHDHAHLGQHTHSPYDHYHDNETRHGHGHGLGHGPVHYDSDDRVARNHDQIYRHDNFTDPDQIYVQPKRIQRF